MTGFPAIVVGGVDVGESSRIVRLLTPHLGRISVMVRAARASKKRFAGKLDPGCRLRVETKKGRGDLPVLVDCDLVRGLDRARRDLDRIALVAYGCEVCAGLAPEDHEAPRLYRLLEVWLDLNEGEHTPTLASRLALEAKALTFAGVAPNLIRCARCGEELDGELRFDPESGGVLHLHCGGGPLVEREGAILLEALRRTPLADTVQPHPVPESVRWVLSDFVQHQLGKALKSRGLLTDLGL